MLPVCSASQRRSPLPLALINESVVLLDGSVVDEGHVGERRSEGGHSDAQVDELQARIVHDVCSQSQNGQHAKRDE